ncbi:MAG: aldose epimerase [Ruthenibacterium sp.]
MYTVTKGTQGAYTAYFLADTDAGTQAVIVPEKGGMATGFSKDGAEYLWLREPNFSLPERPRCAVPVLFPVCGRCANGENIFDGKAYPMDIHGFAHSQPWSVVGQSTENGAALTICLQDSDATKAFYPFSFCVTLTYLLQGCKLSVLQEYQNTGDVPMPFSFGFHPYFAISDVRNLKWTVHAQTQVDFDAGTAVAAPDTVDFPYDADQTTRCYQGVTSPMSFTDTALNHTVTVNFDAHSTNAVLWSQCELGFVCMEPWNGFPNSLQTDTHETLAKGERLQAEMSIVIA